MPDSPKEDPELPELLTIKEAAEYLKMPLPTIYYLAQRGQLPAIQIGGRWRIKRSLLDSQTLRIISVAGENNERIQRLLHGEEFKPRAGTFALPAGPLRNNDFEIFVTDSPDTNVDALGLTKEFRGTIIHIVNQEPLPSNMPTGHFPTTEDKFLETLGKIIEAMRMPGEKTS